MNAWFTEYEVDTGRFVAVRSMPDSAEVRNLYYSPGMAIIRGGFDCETQYMYGGSVVDRPASQASCDRQEIAADGQDVATIAGLPQSCVVAISGPVSATFEVDDGELQFTASVPGVYRISVEDFPVRRWEATIHAV